jgi:glutathione peroxidase-family protein
MLQIYKFENLNFKIYIIGKEKQVVMRFAAAKPQCCYYTLHLSGC